MRAKSKKSDATTKALADLDVVLAQVPATEREWWGHVSSVIECGQHSGLPACCIGFFATVWIGLEQSARDLYAAAVGHVGYVPCPRCAQQLVLGLAVEIDLKACTCLLEDWVDNFNAGDEEPAEEPSQA